MAFQRVEVPVEPGNPLSDRALRLGQSQPETGYSDYLHLQYLRGPFGSPAEGTSHYFIGRYEVTEAQYAVLMTGDCTLQERVSDVAKGGLSWFEAVEIGRCFTEWLNTEAPDALPKAQGRHGFLRLPTEAEWEYAARGGARVDPASFPSRLFFGDGDLRAFATIAAAGSSRARMARIGIRDPNPLGLYDIYGNAEEMMLEPYRLNAVGRAHGQPGGLVTRGGSFRSTAEQIYTALRVEWPLFSVTDGRALAQDTFGLRLIVSAQAIGDSETLAEVRNAWAVAAEAPEDGSAAAGTQLSDLIESEIEPRRRAALEALQLDLRRAQESAEQALAQFARSTILSGAVTVDTMVAGDRRIDTLRDYITQQIDIGRASTQERRSEILEALEPFGSELQELRAAQTNLLLTYRSALDTLAQRFSPADRDLAYALLLRDLREAGQSNVIDLVEQFWKDLGEYLGESDMSLDELRQLALSP